MDGVDRVVGQRLAAARRRRGWSQLEFAELIGRSESWVSKVETGVMRLDSLSLARAIADLLGIAVAHLVAAEDIDPAAMQAGTPHRPTVPVATELPELSAALPAVGGDWRGWDPVQRRWFFAQASGAVLAVLNVLRGNHGGDLGERLAAVSSGRDRIDAETVQGLEQVTLGYRQAYRSASGHCLLGPAHGTLGLLVELAADAGGHRDDLVAMIGQMGALVGTVLMLDLGDADAGARYLRVATRAAQQCDDRELMAFTLGVRAFHAAYTGNPGGGLGFAQAGLEAARAGIHPRTHAWLAAVASEMHATTGSPDGFDHTLAVATTHLERAETQPGAKPWVGIGLFNQAKLTAYRGGGLMRLGRHAQAQTELRDALHRLDPVLRKHRCTAHIDLAQAYAHAGDPDACAGELTRAVGIIAEILHTNSLRRATGLYEGIRAARTPAVRRLGHQLRELEAMT